MKKLLSFLLMLCLAIPFVGFMPTTEAKAEDKAYDDVYYTVREGIYYVSPNGNDTNDGKTLDSAWRSLSTAAYKMSSNPAVRTVLAADGEYYETNEIKPENVVATKENPAMMKSINKWGAKIISNSPYHGVFICNCQHFIFDGFAMDFVSTKKEHFGVLSGTNTSLKISNHITVRNCYITNAPCTGIQLNGGDNVVIENNYLYKCALPDKGANGSGISVYEPVPAPADKEFEDNEYGVIIRNNVAWQNNCLENTPGFANPTDGNGIILDDYRWSQNGSRYNYQKGSLVENNLIFDNGGRGIHAFISDNNTIINNTVFKNGWTIMQYYPTGCGINMESSKGNTVVNNLVVGGGYNNATALNDKSEDQTIYKNNVVAGKVGITNGSSFSEADGNVQLGLNEYDQMGFINPTTDVAFLNFGLKETSPYIAAGNVDYCPDDDLSGATRDKSDGVSIGCYEFGSTNTVMPTELLKILSSNEPIVPYNTPVSAKGKVGNTNAKSYEFINLTEDAMVACAFTSRDNVEADKAVVTLGGTDGKVRVAIYKDNRGSMGQKLTESEVLENIDEEGTYTFELNEKISIKKSETIWFAIIVEGGENTRLCSYNLGNGTGRVAFMPYADTAPSQVTFTTCNVLLSAYLDGVVVGGDNNTNSGNNQGGTGTTVTCNGNVNESLAFISVCTMIIAAVCFIAKKRFAKR